MAASAAEHRRSDPPPDGSARPHARGPGADPGHREPRKRSPARQEGAEHDDGATPARAFPRAGRIAPSAAAESPGAPLREMSRGVIPEVARSSFVGLLAIRVEIEFHSAPTKQ